MRNSTHTVRSSMASPRNREPRPLPHLELDTFDPTGESLVALAPPGHGERGPMEAEIGARAWVQTTVLRKTLEEASGLDRALTARSRDLGQRIEQGDRFVTEMDRRLERAGQAVGVLERAGGVLSALEQVIDRLSAARGEHDSAIAEIDRRTAGAKARVSVMLDEAHQRVGELERAAAVIGDGAERQLGSLSERARAILGHDPLADPSEWDRPAPGSLAETVARATAAAESADESILRLSAMTERVLSAERRLSGALSEAKRFEDDQARHREAVASQQGAEQRMAALVADLESAAASARYNLSQIQQAEAALSRTIERSSARAAGLDSAMEQVTSQAAGLVQMARDVAGITLRAEQARDALAATVERSVATGSGSGAGSVRGGMPRLAPLSAPRPRLDGEEGARSEAA